VTCWEIYPHQKHLRSNSKTRNRWAAAQVFRASQRKIPSSSESPFLYPHRRSPQQRVTKWTTLDAAIWMDRQGVRWTIRGGAIWMDRSHRMRSATHKECQALESRIEWAFFRSLAFLQIVAHLQSALCQDCQPPRPKAVLSGQIKTPWLRQTWTVPPITPANEAAPEPMAAVEI